jgi:coenzyme F420-reducing hydrogenase beta subunit
MKNFIDKSACSGCTACASICPCNAIIMVPDTLGFLYPETDNKKCNHCSLCEKVCSFNSRYVTDHNFDTPLVYAVRHKQIPEIEASRSGAMFAVLSDRVLESDGTVYGAGYTGHFHIVHKAARTKFERDGLRGVKYVQSDMNTVFTQIKKNLMGGGGGVLFSGTPCQTAGLHSFLVHTNTDIKNLYLCDLVCHGVPSPYFWRDYLNYVEKKQNRTAVTISFRDKKKWGWSGHKESFYFKDKTVSRKTYAYLFYRHIMFRRSCGKCPFTNMRRPADITLGDFWGWEKVDVSFNADNKGVSLVIVNTAKGLGLFNACKPYINYIECGINDCLQMPLRHPVKIHRKRDCFEQDYAACGFEYTLRKYGDVTLRSKIKIFILKLLSACGKMARGKMKK